jgi:hypothetical protein
MPQGLIDLNENGPAFWVRWWDYTTWKVGDLTGSRLLDYAVKATADAFREPDHLAPAFPGAFLCPDEAQDFYETSLRVTASSAAALMATNFSWTDRATAVRDRFRVSPGAVARIRELVEEQHREISEAERHYFDRLRHADTDTVRKLEQLRSSAPRFARVDVLHWRGDPS